MSLVLSPALQNVISAIKSLPSHTRAQSNAYHNQDSRVHPYAYDTIVFYKSKSFSGAAAAELYRRASPTEVILFYQVSNLRIEPNIMTLITRNTKLVFINVSYDEPTLILLTSFASEVINLVDYTQDMSYALGNMCKLLSDREYTTPWWVQYHTAMERKEFDDELVTKYSMYLNFIGSQTVHTFNILTDIAPHTFFTNAAQTHYIYTRRVYRAYVTARKATFHNFNVYVVCDTTLRNYVCHLLYKKPDCDFVILVGNTTFTLRGNKDVLLAKGINLGHMAMIHQGYGNILIGRLSNNYLPLIQYI